MRCEYKNAFFLFAFCISSNYCFAWEAAIPETQNTILAEKMLSENKGNILTPPMLNSLKELDKPIGWEFALIDSRNTQFGWMFRLKRKVGNEYYLEYFNATSSNPVTYKYKWVNGYSFHAINNTNKNNPLE